MAVILCPNGKKIGMEYTFCFSLSSGREEFLGIGKMHQGKVLGSMAKYLPLPSQEKYSTKWHIPSNGGWCIYLVQAFLWYIEF